MIEVKVGSEKKVTVTSDKKNTLLDGKPSDYTIEKLSPTSFKVFNSTSIFNVDIIEQNGKELTLSINNQTIEAKISDHIDQILEKLGMDMVQSTVVKEIKAPMPGGILNVLVKEGQSVQEGDQLLILEAMKMENVIKSPGEGIVSKVHVAEKDNVEKNQVLISFE